MTNFQNRVFYIIRDCPTSQTLSIHLYSQSPRQRSPALETQLESIGDTLALGRNCWFLENGWKGRKIDDGNFQISMLENHRRIFRTVLDDRESPTRIRNFRCSKIVGERFARCSTVENCRLKKKNSKFSMAENASEFIARRARTTVCQLDANSTA